jgi:hypothetical protein
MDDEQITDFALGEFRRLLSQEISLVADPPHRKVRSAESKYFTLSAALPSQTRRDEW